MYHLAAQLYTRVGLLTKLTQLQPLSTKFLVFIFQLDVFGQTRTRKRHLGEEIRLKLNIFL